MAGNLQAEVEINSSADKYFKLLSKELHHMPNASSDKIHTVDVHEGDWETPGSVKLWTYTIDGKQEIFKEKIEVDEINKSVTMIALEGHVMELYKSYKFTAKAIPKGERCLVALNLYYEKLKPEVTPPQKYLDLLISVVKDVEVHLAMA